MVCSAAWPRLSVQITLPPGVKGSKEPPPTVMGPAVPGSIDKLAGWQAAGRGTSDVDGSSVQRAAAGTRGWQHAWAYRGGPPQPKSPSAGEAAPMSEGTVKARLRPGAL